MARMWELNQSGMSDREMLETVKQEASYHAEHESRTQDETIRKLIRECPELIAQLSRLSWRRIGYLFCAPPAEEVGSVQSYDSIFVNVWRGRGYSEACVARMWELNQSGMSDREMLETVKQEGLV